MENKKKYQDIFIESLSIDASSFNENIKYNEIPEWDSIGHMTLVSGLEEAFKISMETDDIVCLLYTSPSPRDGLLSRMPSSA